MTCVAGVALRYVVLRALYIACVVLRYVVLHALRYVVLHALRCVACVPPSIYNAMSYILTQSSVYS